jgi:hypothetical protein
MGVVIPTQGCLNEVNMYHAQKKNYPVSKYKHIEGVVMAFK